MSTNFWLQLKKPILALAPMEGVTDRAYRLLCKEYGADVVYTEFMPADGIFHRARKVLEKMKRGDDERLVICQIFGKDPVKFADAAKFIEEAGFDGVDLNFGCPAKKVIGSGGGVALLRNPDHARRLVEAALEKISIPLSIKVRTSIRKERKEVSPGEPERYTALDLVESIKDLPVAAIMVHGRSFEQGHAGNVDTDMIRQVKEKFPGLVLANGGIQTPQDAKTMLDVTGVDGVGIARGSWGQPWIFRQTRELLETGQVTPISTEELQAAILRHASLLLEHKGPHGLIEFRKHFAHFISGRPGAAQMRAAAVRVSTLDDVRDLVTQL